jgi:hypothetical protein
MGIGMREGLAARGGKKDKRLSSKALCSALR